MPRLPRNLHLVATWRSPANAICKNTLHDTSKVLRLPRKLPRIFWKRRKSIAPATQNDFRHVTKHLWMSRSATPATRNEATKRLKPPKMTTSAELTIGTAIRGSRERLRTVANSCERLRTVADGCDRERNVQRTHPQPPDPQSETGTLATHSGKGMKSWMCHLTRVSYHYLSSPSPFILVIVVAIIIVVIIITIIIFLVYYLLVSYLLLSFMPRCRLVFLSMCECRIIFWSKTSSPISPFRY